MEIPIIGKYLKAKDNSEGIAESGHALVGGSNNLSSISSSESDSKKQNLSLQRKYRNAYENFPIVATAINVTSDHVNQKWTFEGPNKESLLELREKLNLNTHLYRVTKCLLKHGNCWVEVVRDNGEVENLKLLNPMTMHTIRKNTGKVIGYVQEIGDKLLYWGEFPDSARKDFAGRGEPERAGDVNEIIQYTYNLQAGEKYGTPPVHSCLTLLGIKDQIESDMKDIVKRYAAPIIHAKIGDETHSPSDENISDVSTQLQDIYSDTEYVTSYLVDMDVLGFKNAGLNVEPILNHVDNQILMGMGVYAVIVGLTSGAERAIAEVQLRAFGRRVKSIQRQIKTEFEDKFIQSQNVGTEEDKLVFEFVDERERQEEMSQIVTLVDKGLISRQKGNDLLPEKFEEDVSDLEPGNKGTDDNISKFANPNDPTKTTRRDETRRVDKQATKNPIDDKGDD